MSIGAGMRLQPVLPDRILEMSEEKQIEEIMARKREWGTQLVILGHHYQRESIVRVSDFVGDSYGLSACTASQRDARYIVFCGVHFMAESARILALPQQRVFHPNLAAGCPMADMAEIDQVELAWETILEVHGEDVFVPITYMNSAADLKAFCGYRGGAVCTSSNAEQAFSWAIGNRKRILFFPDEHLGRNAANSLGIPEEKRIVWDYNLPRGGNAIKDIEHATVILWKGYCHVHTNLTLDHIRDARKRYPGGKIVVHPECREEIVAEADAAGSTDSICKYVENAPARSTILIATEINLVSRLAHEHPDKTIVPVHRSLCHNMYRINAGNLLHTLENLGDVGEILVDPDITRGARMALERMLELA